MTDILGDLSEWGLVLKQIEQLRRAGNVDEHQEGLIRVLRYRENWQLRHAALRAATDIRKPSKDLLEVLLQIVTDEQCGLETRTLACESVRQAIRRHREQGAPGEFEARAAEWTKEFLKVPQPPVLRAVVEAWQPTLVEPAGAAR